MIKVSTILKSSKGVAHMATNDGEYNGYYIPKGTILMANTWLVRPLNPIFCAEFLIQVDDARP